MNKFPVEKTLLTSFHTKKTADNIKDLILTHHKLL